MTIFPSNGEPATRPEPSTMLEDICEVCGSRFDSVGGATVCRDCVKKLFEAKPNTAKTDRSNKVKSF